MHHREEKLARKNEVKRRKCSILVGVLAARIVTHYPIHKNRFVGQVTLCLVVRGLCVTQSMPKNFFVVRRKYSSA